jgi:hypothetical protein
VSKHRAEGGEGPWRHQRQCSYLISPRHSAAIEFENASLTLFPARSTPWQTFGKSTIIKILSSYHEPDPDATLECEASKEAALKAGDPRSLGIQFVHQNLGLMTPCLW